MGPEPQGGLWERKGIPLSGKPLTGGEVGQDGGGFRASEEDAAAGAGKAAPALVLARPACPAWEHTHGHRTGAGRSELRHQTAGQGEDWGWPAQAGWNPTATTTEGVRAGSPNCLRGQA